MRFSHVGLKIFSSFSLISLAIFSTPYFSSAQLTAPEPQLSGNQVVFNAPPPPDQGAPEGRQQGGASRGGTCYEQYGELTALVPITNGVVWSLTSSEQPTLWFYLPSPLTASASVEFVLQDETNDYVYETSISGL